jgi:hypothetical protein
MVKIVTVTIWSDFVFTLFLKVVLTWHLNKRLELEPSLEPHIILDLHEAKFS